MAYPNTPWHPPVPAYALPVTIYRDYYLGLFFCCSAFALAYSFTFFVKITESISANITAMPNPKGNPQYLKPWKPGESGNPAGRPRKRPQSEAHEDFLRMVLPDSFRKELNKINRIKLANGREIPMDFLMPGATMADAIAVGLGKRALGGDATCAKEMRESVEGKATQRFELSSADSGIEVRVSFEAPVTARNRMEREVTNKIIDAAVAGAIIASEEDEDK